MSMFNYGGGLTKAQLAALASAAGLTAVQQAVIANTSAATAPLASSDALNAAQAAVEQSVNAHTDAAVANKATAAALTAAQTALASGQAAVQAAVNAHTDTATAPLATSTALTAAQAALAAGQSAVQSAVNAHTDAVASVLATAASITTVQSALASHSDSLAALSAGQTTLQAAVNAHTDSALSTTQAALLSAVQLAQPVTGEQRYYRRSAVPAYMSKVSGLDVIPTGGIATTSALTANNSGYGTAVYVASGTNSGLWRFKAGYWQRYSLDTNQAVGSAIQVPGGTYTTSGGCVVAAAAQGQYIYYCGIVNTSGTGSTTLYRLDTVTGLHTAMQSLPRVVGASASIGQGWALTDGRLVFSVNNIPTLTQTAAAWTFYVYNPSTNVTPVEMTVALNITKVPSSTTIDPLPACVLPSGELLVIDWNDPASGNRLSCNVTFGASSATVSAAENTGFTNTTYSAAPHNNGTGAFVHGINRVYAKGVGWAASVNPFAYGALAYASSSLAIAGVGGVTFTNVLNSGGSVTFGAWFTGISGLGDAVVPAVRN